MKIIIGAGETSLQGWISTSIDSLDITNSYNWEEFFSPASVDAILAEHVWEHLTDQQAATAATACFQYLKPGGYLRVAVPDGLHPDPHYIEQVKPGGVGAYAWDHKVLYTYKSLKEVFERAGFNITLYEYFDEVGQFHYSDWNAQHGKIYRSKRFDKRNADGILNYTSIVLDARKPMLSDAPIQNEAQILPVPEN